jgi:hypothetical protein
MNDQRILGEEVIEERTDRKSPQPAKRMKVTIVPITPEPLQSVGVYGTTPVLNSKDGYACGTTPIVKIEDGCVCGTSPTIEDGKYYSVY